MKRSLVKMFLLSVLFSQQINAFESEVLFKTINDYLFFQKGEVSLEEKLNELQIVENKINNALLEERNAKNFLLKGLTNCAYMRAYKAPISDKQQESKNNHKLLCQENLREAIKLNIDEKVLSYDQLVVLKVYSGRDIAVDAIDQILATDHYFDDKERVEYLRNKIDFLIVLDRFDEALSEIKLMNIQFPSFSSKEWDDAFLEQMAVKQKNISTAEKALEQEKITSEPKISTPVKIKPEIKTPIIVLKKPKQVAKNTNEGNKYYKTIGIGLLVIFLLGLMFRKRKNKT